VRVNDGIGAQSLSPYNYLSLIACQNTSPGYTAGRGRKNRMDIVRRDLKDMNTTWDEAGELATDRAEWRQRVAQCIRRSEVR